MRISLVIVTLAISISVTAQEPLRIGIIPYKSEDRVLQTFEPVAEWLGERLGREVLVELVDEDELGFRLSRGQYDIGIFKPFPYLQAKEDFPDISLFGTHQVKGENMYYGFIFVRNDSPYNKLTDLNGTDFMFVKPNSTSGFTLPKGVFQELDIDIEKGFFDYTFSYDHQASLDSLVNGAVDGIAISTEEFEDMSEIPWEELRVLSEFDIPYHAYVFAPDLDSLTRDNIKRSLFSANKDPDNRSLFMNPLNITGWMGVNDAYYNSLRRYFEMVRVKPTISVVMNVREQARKYLEEKGDVLITIQEKIRDALVVSDRFSEVYMTIRDSDYLVEVSISLQDRDKGRFHFKASTIAGPIAEYDLDESQLRTAIPSLTMIELLQNLPIRARLLNNGEEWFIPYGTNDGLSAESYTIKRLSSRQLLQIMRMTEMNTYLQGEDLEMEEEVLVSYTSEKFEDELATVLGGSDPLDIFSTEDIWDKIGLFGSIFVGIVSAGAGWYFNTRKRRHFRSILEQTNNILKEFYDDQVKTEARLDELRDSISRQLEDGTITENQFLILKAKIDEIEMKVSRAQRNT